MTAGVPSEESSIENDSAHLEALMVALFNIETVYSVTRQAALELHCVGVRPCAEFGYRIAERVPEFRELIVVGS